MMTYDDRGEGGLRNNDIINKGSFLQQYPKKITQSKLFYALNSNCAWNSFQKERHIVYVVEKKYMLNEGTMGVFLELMTHDDRGEGGVKNCQNGGDIICGCP